MKILGYDYRMEMDKPYSELGVMGRSHFSTQLIQMARDSGKQQMESTVIHEILEICNIALELELGHQTISILESSLYQALTANGVDLSPLLKELGK